MLALDAKLHLTSTRGDRTIPATAMYRHDGITYLSKRADEILTKVVLPPVNGDITAFRKLRRRGSIDFPILNVAVWIRPSRMGRGVEQARIAIGGITSAPFLAESAAGMLVGRELTPTTIQEAAEAARTESRPLDNTDLDFSWRRQMVEVWVRRALEDAAREYERR
jgi:4-hydroxybenzoyl-CoA reductase subunit beta